eukprot:1127165-Rhodomonas_salina.1
MTLSECQSARARGCAVAKRCPALTQAALPGHVASGHVASVPDARGHPRALPSCSRKYLRQYRTLRSKCVGCYRRVSTGHGIASA